jgi:hypothetical protein
MGCGVFSQKRDQKRVQVSLSLHKMYGDSSDTEETKCTKGISCRRCLRSEEGWSECIDSLHQDEAEIMDGQDEQDQTYQKKRQQMQRELLKGQDKIPCK